MDDKTDKQWAKRYLLDPLTAPEPSQETGPGSSFFNPLLGRSLSQKSKARDVSRASHSYPTPPASASPTRSDFHPSNPFASGRYPLPSPNRVPQNPFEPGHSRSASANSFRTAPARYPPSQNVQLGRSFSARRPHPQPSPFYNGESSGSKSISSSTPAYWDAKPLPPQPQSPYGHYHSQQQQQQQRPLQRSASTTHRPPPAHQNPNHAASGLRRSGSITQRYHGDMTHRPLDMLRRDARAADRAPHLRKARPGTDIIDSLDTIGGSYHHGGPYDAALAARNTNPLYSPVAAVHDSTMEAIRATPREFIQDSLEKHVPLQGTAMVPSGQADMSGHVMRYAEGADLMRESDAAGGAYKRWDGIPYEAEDLKGKGEPSYTFERERKEKDKDQRRLRKASVTDRRSQEFELQSGVNGGVAASSGLDRKADAGVVTRQRSVSNAAAGSSALDADTHANGAGASDLGRSNTTGKRISDGLKRRFGSIRRKKVEGEA